MYLIDEEDVAFLEVGEDGGEIPCTVDGGTRGRAYLDAHLVCDDAGERRLAEARWPREEQVVECLATHACGLDENGEIVLDTTLAKVIVERLGTQVDL